MTLQRETFSNIMVRVQVLERNLGKRNGSHLKSHSAMRGNDLATPNMSRNKMSVLTRGGQGDESTDTSFTRILPVSLDPRANSNGRGSTPKNGRKFSVQPKSELPDAIKSKLDTDVLIHDPHSPTKKS